MENILDNIKLYRVNMLKGILHKIMCKLKDV